MFPNCATPALKIILQSSKTRSACLLIEGRNIIFIQKEMELLEHPLHKIAKMQIQKIIYYSGLLNRSKSSKQNEKKEPREAV